MRSRGPQEHSLTSEVREDQSPLLRRQLVLLLPACSSSCRITVKTERSSVLPNTWAVSHRGRLSQNWGRCSNTATCTGETTASAPGAPPRAAPRTLLDTPPPWETRLRTRLSVGQTPGSPGQSPRPSSREPPSLQHPFNRRVDSREQRMSRLEEENSPMNPLNKTLKASLKMPTQHSHPK